MKTDIWKPVPIEASDDGQLRINGRIVATRADSNGYHSIDLQVHRMIVFAFHGPQPNDHERWVVDHIDGNPHNNAAENLRWLTHRDNIMRKGRKLRVLTEAQVAEIKALRPAPQHTLQEMAAQFGVSYFALRAIRAGSNHSNGYGKNSRTILSPEQVEQARNWRPTSPTAAQVGRQYKVSATTIINIWEGRYG